MRRLLLVTTVLALTSLTLSNCSVDKGDIAAKQSGEAAQAEIRAETTNADARISAWLEDRFQENIRRYPQTLAALGIKERMSEWNDPSRAFALDQLDYTKRTLEEFISEFDRSKLSPSMQLSYDLYRRQNNNAIADDKWWNYGYRFNQMFGAQSGIPTFLKNQHRIENIDDARAYIDRLNGVKDYLGAHVGNAQKSAELGIMPPRFVYEHVIRDARNILKGAPFEDGQELNLMAADFKAKVDKLGLDETVKEELYENTLKALITSVGPAYENLISVMEAQQSKATNEDGVWKLPNGADYYANRLNRMTTTNMSANEIHQIGLSEVARIHSEMRDIMKKVKFDGTLQEFFTFLKADKQFVYEDSDIGRDAYLTEATTIIEVMKTRLDEMFLTGPKAELEVRRVEPFREKSAGKAFYNRPALDGSRPGIYYANLYKISDMPKYQMEALAYHEGIPGHHMQIAMAQELSGVPSFQKLGFVTAYTEGWGLYSEYLPKEMGFYQDPYSDFGRLAMEIWRAARLVVDTGIHHKKWTREQAIEYLLENTPNPENDCVKAIERYIVMPGQATAYKIGMMKILDLRQTAKSKLGNDFDIREFHDVVLKNGPVPLSELETQISNWIETKHKSAKAK